MYTFSSTENIKIQKTADDPLQLFNYIADHFQFEVDELELSHELTQDASHRRLESLLHKVK